MIFEGAAARIALRAKSPPGFTILALNLVPAACVLLFGWNAGVLLLLYWAENVIIGGFNAVKMGLSGVAWGLAGLLMAAVMIPFFIFHYGLFSFVHGMFVVLIGMGPRILPDMDASPFGLYELVMRLAREEPGFGRSLLAILAAQAVAFLFDWLIPGGPRKFNPMVQMLAPYPRIIVLHLTIMAAAIPVLLLASPAWAVLALALLKTVFEMRGIDSLIDEDARQQADGSVAELERLLKRKGSAP